MMRMREFMWTTSDGTTYRLRTDQLDGCVWVDIGNTNEEELLQALAANPDIIQKSMEADCLGAVTLAPVQSQPDPEVLADILRLEKERGATSG